MDFERVRRVPRSMWYQPHYLSKATAGDLLLMGEANEKTGGLLRSRRMPVFLTVTPAQVWGGYPVPWPQSGDRILSIRIVGDAVEVNPPTASPPRPSSSQAS